MNKTKLVIVGASGHGKVVADIAISLGRYQEIIFLDDDLTLHQCLGRAVMGTSDNAKDFISNAEFFVAIGKAESRMRILNDLVEKGATIATLVHPSAIIGSGVEIGVGTAIMAGTVINAETQIGVGCIINTGATVDHDCKLGEGVHIAVGAHLSGNVKVGDLTWIGAGAVIRNNVSITNSCLVGVGAAVVKNIDISGTYIGVPAKLV